MGWANRGKARRNGGRGRPGWRAGPAALTRDERGAALQPRAQNTGPRPPLRQVLSKLGVQPTTQTPHLHCPTAATPSHKHQSYEIAPTSPPGPCRGTTHHPMPPQTPPIHTLQARQHRHSYRGTSPPTSPPGPCQPHKSPPHAPLQATTIRPHPPLRQVLPKLGVHQQVGQVGVAVVGLLDAVQEAGADDAAALRVQQAQRRRTGGCVAGVCEGGEWVAAAVAACRPTRLT